MMYVDVCRECDICSQFGRPPAKPVVTLPLSKEFNDVIAVDLHKLSECGDSVYYLHIVDLFTRFSQAEIIMDKKTGTIIDALNRKWCFVFGTPDKISSDNGGEFDSEEFKSNAENLDFEPLTTAAESPWSNSCVGRHNEDLTETFLKTRKDVPGDDNLCLQQAVFAKNCLTNFSGYSPYQLVYG